MKLKELLPLIDENQPLRISIYQEDSKDGVKDDLDLTTFELNKKILNIYSDGRDIVIILNPYTK